MIWKSQNQDEKTIVCSQLLHYKQEEEMSYIDYKKKKKEKKKLYLQNWEATTAGP